MTASAAGVVALALGVPLAAAPTAAAGTDDVKARVAAAYKADFNGDGYADTVSPGPYGTVGDVEDAGYVTVVYGSPNGADTQRRQVITQQTDGIPGDPEKGGGWGGVLTARDFNSDGVTDLAVSNLGGRAGVTIIWGAKGEGLTKGVTVAGDDVNGSRMAAGDVNGDGYADLVTAKGGGWGGSALQVLHGPFTGGEPASTEDLTADVGDSDLGEITVGDVTGDGIDDVFATYGFEEMSRSSQFWPGGRSGAGKPVPVEDAATAAIGDVDKDGRGDLVIRTVPGGVLENLPYDHGTVKVLYGTDDGPSKTRTTTLDQNSPGVPGANEDGDQFGASLATGDVNGDGYADVVAGVPGEDIGSGASGKDTGAAVQLLGGSGGLSGTGAKAFHQGTSGVPGAVEAEDAFGKAVALGNTDADGYDDLAVGAPGEDGTASQPEAGAVWVLRGSASGGLATDGIASWGPAALGAPAANARLGMTFPR
nr:FG-GAP-like repeat-containing protein [Streptomyces boncukensis]